MLGGDLNIDLIDDSINCNTFNTLYAFSYFPLINIATRIAANTAKCLDHFWYNKLNVSFAGALITDISDHYPIFTVINNINKGGLIKKTFRDHSDINLRRIYNDVRQLCLNFDYICRDRDVDYKCEWFLENLYSVYNRACPKKNKIYLN